MLGDTSYFMYRRLHTSIRMNAADKNINVKL